MRRQAKRNRPQNRRGAVAVEMAFIAPVFLAVLLGLTEASRMYETQNQMQQAVRSGARLAAMDRDGITSEGETTNQKVEADIKAFLDASGLDGDLATVTITHPDSDAAFDLDDPANNLDLFTVTIQMSMDDLGLMYGAANNDAAMLASITLRNARSSLVR